MNDTVPETSQRLPKARTVTLTVVGLEYDSFDAPDGRMFSKRVADVLRVYADMVDRYVAARGSHEHFRIGGLDLTVAACAHERDLIVGADPAQRKDGVWWSVPACTMFDEDCEDTEGHRVDAYKPTLNMSEETTP
jgi:hypothetical protein